MAGYVGSKTVNLSTTGADIAGDADVSGALDVGGGLTVDNDGSTVLTVDRATSDGTIIDLQKSGSSVGSIGSYSGSFLKIQSAGNQSGTLYGTTAHYPLKNDALSNADIDLGGTSNRFKDLYLSGGVFLGGTGSANKLDDYEEGTWTPSITGSTTNPTGLTYSNQIGQYTKVGRQVTVHFRIKTTAGSGGSGTFNISGLPFTPSSERSSAIISFSRRITNGGGPLAVHSYVGSSGFNLYKYTDADDFDTAIEISDVTSFASLVLHGSLTYYAT